MEYLTTFGLVAAMGVVAVGLLIFHRISPPGGPESVADGRVTVVAPVAAPPEPSEPTV